MKHYNDYVRTYSELKERMKPNDYIVKQHIYICMNFLEDNGVSAPPSDRSEFKQQLTTALAKFPVSEQKCFMNDIMKTLMEVQQS